MSHRIRDLESRVAQEIRRGGSGPTAWAGATGPSTHPVVVVGAGQAGLVVANGLRRKGIADVLVIDGADEGHAGPWTSYARMRTLRTPKWVPWPTWDVPSASPEIWFRAQFGDGAWDELVHVPTTVWHSYLEWYRDVCGIAVEFGSTLEHVAVDGDRLELTIRSATGVRRVRTEHLVLATGLEGAGGRRVPAALFDDLDPDTWAHIHDDIDFRALAGRRIGILGGGTGAFDNAATALEAGAASVTVHMRRAEMPDVSPYRWMEFPGILDHYSVLGDDQKWRFNEHLSVVDQPATQSAVTRAFEHPGFEFRTSSAWHSIHRADGELVVATSRGTERYDFVMAATGVTVDLTRRPELSAIVDDIALWRDRYTPPVDTTHPELLSYPYLDDRFGLQPRNGDPHSALRRIHLFNHGARMSLGVLSHQVSGLAGGAERLVGGIVAGIVETRSSDLLTSFVEYDDAVGIVLGSPQEVSA